MGSSDELPCPWHHLVPQKVLWLYRPCPNRGDHRIYGFPDTGPALLCSRRACSLFVGLVNSFLYPPWGGAWFRLPTTSLPLVEEKSC